MHCQVDHLNLWVVQHHPRIGSRRLDPPTRLRGFHGLRINIAARHDFISKVPVRRQVRPVGNPTAPDQPDPVVTAARRLRPVVLGSKSQVVQLHARGLGVDWRENATLGGSQNDRNALAACPGGHHGTHRRHSSHYEVTA